MYCKTCKREIENTNNGVCPYCGGSEFTEEATDNFSNENQQRELQTHFNQSSVPPKEINQTAYLVFAILATVLCCLPLGIPAIVFSAKINGAQLAGNYALAGEYAKKAKIFTIIAAVLGVVAVVLYFVLIVLGVFVGLGSSSYGYY